MKRFLTLLTIIMFLVLPAKLNGEPIPEDMTVFKIAILLQHCDQSDEIKVVRLRNTLTGKDAFCLQPHVNYKPNVNEYFKIADGTKALYDLYQAYEQLEKTEDAFITVQLMIWEELTGEQLTFDGKDASDYLKDEVLELIAENSKKPDPEIINDEAYIGETRTIQIENLDKYNIITDIKIIESDEDSLSYEVEDDSKENAVIQLIPKSEIPEGAYIYSSENSQDIYAFEGAYEPLKARNINIRIQSDDLSITYQKLDHDDQPIEGAEFTLYRIDPEGSQSICFLKNEENVDLYEKLLTDLSGYERGRLSILVSERYAQYLDDGFIRTAELGYFPYILKYDDQIIKEGRIYVTDTLNESFKEVKTEKIKTVSSLDQEINSVSGLKANSQYYFCESEPKKGYTYAAEPCHLIDTSDDTYLNLQEFRNERRTYTLHLIKNNPLKNIALDGALFRLNYLDEGKEKEYIFKTGSLNIFREDNCKYLIYRHENSDDCHIVELNADQYIEDDVPYGIYHYYLSNDFNIDPSKFNRTVKVEQGSFIIENLPYSAVLKLEELEAPKGYFIDEAKFELSPSIAYGEITFTNSRVNSFDIIPNNRRKIPKTCIGD